MDLWKAFFMSFSGWELEEELENEPDLAFEGLLGSGLGEVIEVFEWIEVLGFLEGRVVMSFWVALGRVCRESFLRAGRGVSGMFGVESSISYVYCLKYSDSVKVFVIFGQSLRCNF
jgi:hypothetical protein